MLRVLPISFEPVPGETCDAYIDRLAAAHRLEILDIHRELMRDIGRVGWNSKDPRLPAALAQLAGVSVQLVKPTFSEHGMWVRCGHQAWGPRKCERCERFDVPRAACIICAGGMQTLTVACGGPFCTRHRQWTFRGLRATIPELDDYEQAELVFRTVLWERGVTLHTGEINLAAAFVRAWNDGTTEWSAPDARSRLLGLESPRSYEEVLLSAYPEVIRVAVLITKRRFVTPLLDTAVSALRQADRLAVAIAQACGGQANNLLLDFARAVIGHAHHSMLYAAGLRRTPRAQHVACPMARALIVAAGRKRACLLRHSTPRQIRGTGQIRTDGTPRPRTTRNRPLEPDELALP